eukprot:TRINITY_DN111669_c0_g1_i1.p1 TRINITY_DN111669_c0_g1~~TRINITY_DN111669_c0_g1_i1.p1  ORF type:complete len:286 (-),score=50.88 TRINITY_DN111669_c0_g1_i1:122-949(-)
MELSWGVVRNELGMAAKGREGRTVDVKAACAEFVAMTLFVIVGCGTACANGAADGQNRLLVALAFGMGILVLAYACGHHSGGHINCAVTFSLVLGGQVPWYQGCANLFAQLLGSMLGAGFLAGIFPCNADMTTTLGTNIISPRFDDWRALLAEVVGTFLLCFVVWETAVSKSGSKACGKNACIAIGFAVFLAHVLLLPIDGCSINPTRSFGPAVVSAMRSCPNLQHGGLEDLWVMWVGPLLGAAIAAAVNFAFRDPPRTEESNEDAVTAISILPS